MKRTVLIISVIALLSITMLATCGRSVERELLYETKEHEYIGNFYSYEENGKEHIIGTIHKRLSKTEITDKIWHDGKIVAENVRNAKLLFDEETHTFYGYRYDKQDATYRYFNNTLYGPFAKMSEGYGVDWFSALDGKQWKIITNFSEPINMPGAVRKCSFDTNKKLIRYVITLPNGQEQLVYNGKKTAAYYEIDSFYINENNELKFLKVHDTSKFNWQLFAGNKTYSGNIHYSNYIPEHDTFAFRETLQINGKSHIRVCIDGTFSDPTLRAGYPSFNSKTSSWEYTAQKDPTISYLLVNHTIVGQFEYIAGYSLAKENNHITYNISKKTSPTEYSHFIRYGDKEIKTGTNKNRFFQGEEIIFYPDSEDIYAYTEYVDNYRFRIHYSDGTYKTFFWEYPRIYFSSDKKNVLMEVLKLTMSEKFYINGKRVRGSYPMVYQIRYNEKDCAYSVIVGKNFIDGLAQSDDNPETTFFFGMKKKTLVYKLKIK